MTTAILATLLALYLVIGLGILAWMVGDPEIRKTVRRAPVLLRCGYVLLVVLGWPGVFTREEQ